MNRKWSYIMSALAVCGVLIMTMVFSGCNLKAKQKAVLAIEAAKLSISDAKNGKANLMAPSTIQNAESDLKLAEKALDKKDYSSAAQLADAASMKARDAVELAKKKAASKKGKASPKK